MCLLVSTISCVCVLACVSVGLFSCSLCLLVFYYVYACSLVECMYVRREKEGDDHDVDSDVNIITDLSINAGNDV